MQLFEVGSGNSATTLNSPLTIAKTGTNYWVAIGAPSEAARGQHFHQLDRKNYACMEQSKRRALIIQITFSKIISVEILALILVINSNQFMIPKLY
jgi:hypothetical protein